MAKGKVVKTEFGVFLVCSNCKNKGDKPTKLQRRSVRKIAKGEKTHLCGRCHTLVEIAAIEKQ